MKHTMIGMGLLVAPWVALTALVRQKELEIAIQHLLDACADLRFEGDGVPPDVGLFLRCPAALPVTFTESRPGAMCTSST
jgi:hypothetical protein